MIGVPSRIISAHQVRALEHTTARRKPGGIAMPNSGLHAYGFDTGLAQSRGQRAIAVSNIKTEIGDAMNIQRSLRLIAPLKVQRFAIRQFEVAPALVIQATPDVAVEDVRSAFLNRLSQIKMTSGRNRRLHRHPPDSRPDLPCQSVNRCSDPIRHELQQMMSAHSIGSMVDGVARDR